MPGGSNFDAIIREVLNSTSTKPTDVADIVPFPRKFTTPPISEDSDLSFVPGTPEYNARMDAMRQKMMDAYRGSRKPASGDDT